MAFIKSRSKYRAVPTVVDGIRFASKKEAARYQELKLAQHAGDILDLELQPSFKLFVEGVHVTTYRADFRYRDTALGRDVVEDVKGFKTPEYKIKAKLFQALFPRYLFRDT
jgi:hypothetical protein